MAFNQFSNLTHHENIEIKNENLYLVDSLSLVNFKKYKGKMDFLYHF